MDNPVYENSAFIPFDQTINAEELAEGLSFSLGGQPHPLCLLAVSQLQHHLKHQQEWIHNFGLDTNMEGVTIGKMFGILVVRQKDGVLGYLAAFSGKLAGANHHNGFVPPIFDGLAAGGFLNAGMEALSVMNEKIRFLESSEAESIVAELQQLKVTRKNYSNTLQYQIFDQYHFLNKQGFSKSLFEAFRTAGAGKPPAGAGECAAPKLLQYAFQQEMEPLGLAEFWWGLSPKSDHWKHGQFYPPCLEKCAPILEHMLS